MWEIGDVGIPNRVVVAPTTDINSAAFRVTVKEFGAGLVVYEMISNRGIKLRNKKTLEVLYIDKREYPLSIQIFGGDKETLVETAKFVEENTQVAIIDINMGYPTNKIIKVEVDAKWLLDPNKVHEMVHTVSSAASLPVAAGVRTGWDEDHLYATDSALAAKQVGASTIAMHGRARIQMYEETANWDILKEVKKRLTIPFMGNGDVKAPEDVERMLEYVGVDDVMIGRAALGNPWIIQRTKEYLETDELIPEPPLAEGISIAKVHLQRLVDLKGEKIAVRRFCQRTSYHLKGTSRAARMKVAINQVETQRAVIDLLDAFVEKISKVTVATIEE